MTGHGEKKSRNKEKALAALLTYPTIGEAAKASKISESTLLRWLQDKDFHEQFMSARRQAVSHAVSRIQQATTSAVETLTEVMENTESPPASRVSASKTVLDIAFKAVELEDLAARIEALEKATEGGGSK